MPSVDKLKGSKLDGSASCFFLLCRIGAVVCALPVAQVSEVMRRLPIESFPGLPAYVPGLSLIRGLPTPVIDAAKLLEAGGGDGKRYVLLQNEERKVALMVDDVVGVRFLGQAMLRELPPLFRNPGVGFIAALGQLDVGLFMLLQTARFLPDETWTQLDTATRP